MATLEQRLQDVEYKFWVKDGLCLAYVKEGLEKFADERSKKLHDYVKSALPNNCTAFHNVCGHAKVSFDKNRMKWTLGCCVACDAYTDELVKLQSPPFKLKQSNWKNTKTQLWPHDHWNMSKVYMNEGQKASQKNSKDTDLCGILNFIENCSIPKVDIQNAQNLSKVRKARNKIFHSASMKMTKADFEASTKAMVDLLEDPFFICREKEAQNAVTAIKQIQQADFEISKMHEFQVLTVKIEDMRNQHDALHDEVDTLKTDINEEKGRLSAVLENQEKIQETIDAMQNEIRQKEDQIKELFIELAFLKKMVNDDSQLSEQIDIRVKTVETSLERTDIEIRDIKLNFKGLKYQMAEMKADIASGKTVHTRDNSHTVQYLTERNEELEQNVQELKSQLQENILALTVKKRVCDLHQQKIQELEFQIEQLQKERHRGFALHHNNDDDETVTRPTPVRKEQFQSASMKMPLIDESGVHALQDDLKHTKERNEVLHYEIDRLRQTLNDLRSQDKQEEREKELQDLKSRNCVLEAKLECFRSNEKLLKKEVEESNSKLDIEKEKIRAIEYQLENFIASSKSVDAERKEEQKQYKASIFGLKIQIQFLEDDKEDTENLLKVSKKENKDLNAKVCQLMNEVNETEKKMKDMKTKHDTELSRLQYNTNVTKLRLTTESEKCRSIEDQLKHAQGEIDKLVTVRKNETQAFKQTLSAVKEKVIHLERTGKQREEELKEVRNAESLLKLKLENLSEDYERKSNELRTLEESKETVQSDLVRYCTEVKTLSEVVDKLTYKLKLEESKHKSLNNQIEQYQSEVAKLTTDRKNELETSMRFRLETQANYNVNESADEWHTPDEEIRSFESIPMLFSEKDTKEKSKVRFDDSALASRLQFQKQSLGDTEQDTTMDTLDSSEVSEKQISYQTLATTPRHKRHKERNHVTEDTMLESTGLLNMKVGSRNQIDVMIDDDDKTCPWVSGCVFIPNGSLVLCDYRNNKIKMLNKALTMQASLSLHAQPWDIAVANNTTVVVTLLNSQRLQFVQVEPSLEKKQYIKLSMMCWGVEVVEDEIFITCFDKNGEGSVRVLDFEGIVKRRIVIQNGTQEFNMLKGPYNLTVSPASGNIFVSDYVGNVVTCMTSNGNVLYQYRDALLNGPKDILVDCSENILICSARAYNLQIVDAEGVKHRTLASSKDKIMKPWSVAYRSDDKTLVVGCQGKHLLVIGLDHSRRRRESTEDRI